MSEALERAEKGIAAIQADLGSVIDTDVLEKFWDVLWKISGEKALADEHYGSLRRSMSNLEDLVSTMRAELGAAQHIVSAGVHRAQSGGGSKSLVL